MKILLLLFLSITVAESTTAFSVLKAQSTQGRVDLYSKYRDFPQDRVIMMRQLRVLAQEEDNRSVTDFGRKVSDVPGTAWTHELNHDFSKKNGWYIRETIMTCGVLNVVTLRDSIVNCFLNAERMAPADGVRQSAIIALSQMGADPSVFLTLLLNRQNFWLDNSLFMSIQALKEHGDSTCVPYVSNLRGNLEAALPTFPEDYLQTLQKLIQACEAVESKFGGMNE